ncbi:MAG: NAD(P)H-hydrate epimerase [Thaumarchaeota archaeon]|nr:NAD(P)H-hydrate epimerase [Nitrososphaerota archaeon]
MKGIVSPQEMKKIEQKASEMGIPPILLMENAGRSVADLILNRFPNLTNKSICIVCGTGNNGGDGFVASRHLAVYGAKINVILLGIEDSIKTAEAQSSWRQIKAMTRTISTHVLDKEDRINDVKPLVVNAEIVVDAVLGTGVEGNLRPMAARAIELINSSSAYKISVDIPSGLDPLTGVVHDIAVEADVTVTFHKRKIGLEGRKKQTGEVVVSLIGIPIEAEIQ